MKTIAIDFETANEERGSACSVGLAWIEDGAIVRVEERLIRPKDMRFSPFNIAVHGIRPADVEDAPEFPEVMEEFIDDFHGATMIAHNAAFDFSVMRASFDKYRQSYPDLSYLCSVKIARHVWPNLASHKLNVIAHHLQLRFVHHNAAEDAVVCAAASIAAAKALSVAHIHDLPEKIGMVAGRLTATGYQPCSMKNGLPPGLRNGGFHLCLKQRNGEDAMTKKTLSGLFAGFLVLLPVTAANSQVVGEVGVDWIGNDIMIEAIADPKIKGVTCHVTYFERGVIDRLKNGNWFEDPSNNAISCSQTGPVEIGDINVSKGGEEVFRQGMSLVWKKLVVSRVYDKANDTLIYLVHARELTDGSAKMAISTVPLYNQQVTWEKGKP